MTRLFIEGHQSPIQAPLPVARRKRWQPIRGGLLNLYLYDYEEFRYEHGRLILRGNNGTGKSRVMAIQLPFLFDGRLNSSRVEPDADPSKKMEWNLLMGRYGERLGYTWIEFGRVLQTDSNGEPRVHLPQSSTNGDDAFSNHNEPPQDFVTLGCGLSATKGSGMREPWFFITDQRVGKDLFLQSEAGHALSKSALLEAIGERGTVYTTAKEYRLAIDEKLFGLGKQRYEAMVDLLIQLRRPQLSRHLDEQMLARVLGEALPPPSEQMITDVAESFRGLESDRTELDRFRLACEGVDRFLKTYRRYARIASRRRAADVRQSHHRYESANRELRQAEREKEEAILQLTNAAEVLRSLEIEEEEVIARIEALRTDPKMRSADAIKRAADDEQQALIDLNAAKVDSRTASERRWRRRTAQSDACQQAETQLQKTSDVLQRASDLAANGDLTMQHQSAFSSLKLQLDDGDDAPLRDPRTVRRQIEEITATRIKSFDQLRKRNAVLSEAERELTQAQTSRDDAQRRVDRAIEDQRTADAQRRRAVDDFLEAYRLWRRDSDELIAPSEEEIATDMDEWSEHPDDISPVAKAVHEASVEARQNLNDERVRVQHQAEIVVAETSEAEKRFENLNQGFQEPPPLPVRADESARSDRGGAPFWSLVDFTASCSAEQQANIEAALESAGFLNAWVLPDGSVVTSDFADVLLSIANATDVPANRSLLEVLKPDGSRSGACCDVTDDVIERVLRKVGYEGQDSPTWIASDGRWQNGPLHGQSQKDFAQYIGHDAREKQRIRRLEAVRADLERLGEQSKRLDQQRQSIEDRIRAIAKKLDAFPSDSGIRQAATAVTIAAKAIIERRKGLTEAEHVVRDRQTTMGGAREARDRDARDLGLLNWVGRLDELERTTTDYRRILESLWPSIEHFESLKAQYVAAIAAVQEAERDVQLREEQQHEKQIRHARASQRLKTLQETIGAEAAEIQRELAAAEELRRRLHEGLKQARSDESKAGSELARADERIKLRRETVNTDTERRQSSCDAFQRLCSLGLLKTAGESPDDDTGRWSVSRTVEIARQTESAFSQISDDDAAWDRVQQAVTTTIQDLNTALSQHAFTSTLSTTDGLYCVTVPYQGRDRSVHELRELLSEEVQQRQLILDEREREVIENHLIGEVASKLHEQIHEAHKLVDQMNAEIQKRPMSTGMMLKFDWKPDEDHSEGIVEMCKKLLAATGTWSPSERAAIGRYLQEHIKDVRGSHETGTWNEHLAEAFDYRRWHRFWVMRKQETGWKRLTKRTHGTGSGGEKAVALTIPQFAAAAAHYSSARDDAPRLILLDEAFVGIDPDMRGKCMELIEVFDLDFLLTSESEWGCYPGLPGVATYQLSTRTGFDAVFLTRWIWNGSQRLKDDRPLPPAARLVDG